MQTVETTTSSPNSTNALVSGSFVIIMWEYNELLNTPNFFEGFDDDRSFGAGGNLITTDDIDEAKKMGWEEANKILLELVADFPDYGHYILSLNCH